MKNIIKKTHSNILIYDAIFIGIFIMLNFFLYIINIKLRSEMFMFIMVLLAIITIVGITQYFLKSPKKIRINIILSIMVVVLILLNIPSSINLSSIFDINTEHTVTIDGKNYVAIIKENQYTDIIYYDYIGPFFRGTKERIHGYFEDCPEDPYKSSEFPSTVIYTYFDNQGIKTIEKSINYNSNGEEIYTKDSDIKQEENNSNYNDSTPLEEMPTLSENKFGNIILRFVNFDYILGQNQLVGVIKSTDNGKNFQIITKEVIKVSNEARFIFLTQNLGFAISTGRYNLKNDTGLYVTQDGGKTFEYATIKYQSNAGIETFIIEDYPYYENGQLKIDCLIYDIFKNNTYEELTKTFISEDNGLTWILEK